MNKKIFTSLVLSWALLALSLYSERLGELPTVLKPQMIRIYQEHLYVVEGHKIHHYTLPRLQYEGMIGKEGEGPGELHLDPARTLILSVVNNELRAESRNKIVIFSLNGRFIREERKPPSVLQAVPFGKNLLIHHILYEPEERSFFALDLTDKDGKKIKELYRQKFFQFKQNLYPIADGLNFCVVNDQVWVECSPEGFILECFDSQGQRVKKTTHSAKQLPVSTQDREKAFNHYLKIPFLQRLKNEQGEAALKQFLNQQTAVYPDYFPTIRHLKWDGSHFVIRTYEKTAAGEVHLLLDKQGQLLGRCSLPEPQEIDFLVAMQGDKQHYDVYKGYYYYLRTVNDDEDGESWILHREKMDIEKKCQGCGAQPHPQK